MLTTFTKVCAEQKNFKQLFDRRKEIRKVYWTGQCGPQMMRKARGDEYCNNCLTIIIAFTATLTVSALSDLLHLIHSQ